MKRVRLLCHLLALSLIVAACQQSQPEPAAPQRLESPELQLALASLPAPFEEISSTDDSWTFRAPGEAADGTLVVTAAPEAAGSINLVDSVKARQAWFESAAEGQYFGNRELGGPFGTIYTARGKYAGDAGVVEETWAYAIHPAAYRLLSIQYTYPTGESGTRVEQLLEFLGEIEPLGSGGDAETSDSSG